MGEEMLQQVAAELNLSETAYVIPTPPQNTNLADPWRTHGRFSLRWFTPTKEVPLCGHATLATAHVLFHCLGLSVSNLDILHLQSPVQHKNDLMELLVKE